jgi:hypothetical protein
MAQGEAVLSEFYLLVAFLVDKANRHFNGPVNRLDARFKVENAETYGIHPCGIAAAVRGVYREV